MQKWNRHGLSNQCVQKYREHRSVHKCELQRSLSALVLDLRGGAPGDTRRKMPRQKRLLEWGWRVGWQGCRHDARKPQNRGFSGGNNRRGEDLAEQGSCRKLL